MKKVLFFVLFINLFFYTTAFAESTEMPTSFKITYKSINANQIQISWEPIPDVKEYRICVANNCSGPDETKIWITIYPNQTSYIFDLPVGKTERFLVHAWMQQSATKWTWTDDRPNLLGLKWDNNLGYVNYTNNWVDPNVITTTTTISTEQENKNYEASCASQTWTVNGNCVIVNKQTKKSINTTPIKTTPKTIVQKPLLTINPRLPDSASWNASTQNIITAVPEQEKEKTLMFGLKVSEFIVIMSILALAFIYLLIQQMLNFKMKSKRFGLEKVDREYERQAREYELRELAKAKLNNEHEQTLKKIDHDVVKDRLDYTERQLKNERDFNIEQQKISAHNAEQVLNYVMPILQSRDNHELKMAEIKASSSNSILHPEDITEARVKFKK